MRKKLLLFIVCVLLVIPGGEVGIAKILDDFLNRFRQIKCGINKLSVELIKKI